MGDKPALARVIENFPFLQWFVHLAITRVMRPVGFMLSGRTKPPPMALQKVPLPACSDCELTFMTVWFLPQKELQRL